MADERAKMERQLAQQMQALYEEDLAARGGVPRARTAPQKAGPLDLGVGLKERLAFLNQTFNPVEAIGQSMGAGERLMSGDVEGYDQLAALGDMLSGTASVLPGVGPLVRGSRTAVRAANTAKPSGAVLRQDDTFRGEGPITTSISKATKPYAVRVTGQSQIDDMIQSGMVRPPEGGYGGKPVVYFHEMDEAAPKSVFHTPKSDPGKGYSIVMKSENAAGREGPISLDDLEHIWTLRDGEMVDVLDEVKAMNRDFDVQKFNRGGPVAPNRMTAYQNARAATPPQKGLYSSELLLDNLIGLDNEYLSAGERLRQDFSADPLGFLKNAGVSAYEGTKSAVMSPIETIQGVGDAIYGSGEDLLRGIDNKVQEMFGVSYDEATPEQVTQAREALLGDVLTVGSLAPGLGPASKGAKAVTASVAESIDRANVNNTLDFLRETEATYNPSQLAGMRMYTPDLYEEAGMRLSPRPGEVDYLNRVADADYLESLGYSNEAVSNATGILDIPMRRVGEDSNYPNLRVAAVPDELFDAYRTRKPKVDVKFYDPKRKLFGLLPPREGGYASPKYDEKGRRVPGEHEIGISRKADPRLKQNIFDHEMTHVDLEEGDVLPDAIGGNPDFLNLHRIYTLKELTKSLKTASPEEKVKIRAQMKELLETTAEELYYNNPGEMLARLSEGDRGGTFSVKRLTASQVLNPYLNRASLPKRIVEAGLTSLFSDTRSYMPAIQRAGNDLGRILDEVFTGGRNTGLSLSPPGYDVFRSVPMDLNKAVLPPSLGRQKNRYSEGGIVKGSYLDNDPYD